MAVGCISQPKMTCVAERPNFTFLNEPSGAKDVLAQNDGYIVDIKMIYAWLERGEDSTRSRLIKAAWIGVAVW